ARFSIIHVLETNPEIETEGLKYVEKIEREAREHLDTIKRMAAEENIECEVVVRRDDQPHRAIADEAEKRNADVIVMGRRGRSALDRMFIGSVTSKVIGYAPCNVLVVPRAAVINCKRILVANDGSKYGEAAAAKAIDIAKRCGSELIAVSVVPSEMLSNISPDTGFTQEQIELMTREMLAVSERSVTSVVTAAQQAGVKVEQLVLGGRPYETIVETAKEKRCDLIVVGSHGRTGLKKLFMGSVAERVIGLSPCAVLVVKK
ncbi:MAG: universal stress protein, partial [bacterium]